MSVSSAAGALWQPLEHEVRPSSASTAAVVSRVLGRASIATTASFYAHVQPSMLRRSADRMDKLLGKASGAR